LSHYLFISIYKYTVETRSIVIVGTRTWKAARLVIIPKPGKNNLGEVKSYRLISLLPVLGKALESVIIDELTKETNLDSHGEQHGFTAHSGRNTSSSWPKIENLSIVIND